MLSGLKIGPNTITVGRAFGLAFAVSDNLSVGFYSMVPSTTSYNLVMLSYFLNPILGFSIAVGADTVGVAAANTAAGAGMFVNIARSRSDTGLSTALKLRLEYLFDTALGLTNGDVVLSVGASFGI